MRVRKALAPFSALRFALAAIDMSCAELAERLGIVSSTLSLKMNDRQPFTQTEQYAILDILEKPDESLYEFFPRNGRKSA